MRIFKNIRFVAVLGVFLGGLSVGWAVAGQTPGLVTLDSMANLYDTVYFDHAAHETFTDSCATCHHHTTGEAPVSPACQGCHAAGQAAGPVACQGCHLAEPFSADALRAKEQNIHLYHRDKVGLKGAYHRSCTGCHREMGGPVGCTDCHDRSAAGDAFFHVDAGDLAPTADESAED